MCTTCVIKQPLTGMDRHMRKISAPNCIHSVLKICFYKSTESGVHLHLFKTC